ncbi:MAG TPA: ATP-dependent Clp protease proteolytic subunit [Streptosporangiaceae bacterium]|jgi:ATP-dependent Clp protease protease subunit|nr:ATP-dependent Clp protease proteolytic subunit [Streptosporangiaceae bacterium]
MTDQTRPATMTMPPTGLPWGPPPHPFPGPPEPETVPGPARSQLWFAPAEPVSIYEQLLRRRIVLANGQLTDESATRLCAQLLTLDAEGDGPIRFELQNLGAELTAAITLVGVLDTVGVPVRARVAGRMSGAALGVLAACPERAAYPNAVFAMSEPTVEFGGTVAVVTAREEQTRTMVDGLYERLAETSGHEVDEIRADARAYRVLTAAEARDYGLVTEIIESPAKAR